MASSPESSETPNASPPPTPSSSSSSSSPPAPGESPPPPPKDSSPPPAPKEASPPTSSSTSPPKQEATPPPPSPAPQKNASPPPAPSPPPASKTPNPTPTPTPTPTATTPPPPQVSPPPPPPPAAGKEIPTPPAPKEPSTERPPLAPPPPHRETSQGQSNAGGGRPAPDALSPPKGDSSSDNDNGFWTPTNKVYIGVGAGAILLLALAAVCIVCMRKKKRKDSWPPGQMQYYGDPAGGRKVSQYYNNAPNWYGPQSMEQSHNGPPGYMQQGQHGGGWGHSPASALPPVMSSGEMSSNNFSGPHQAGGNPASPNMTLGFNKSTFTYDELAAATNNFSQANLLGQGGFGYVHKGTLPNGKVVAVKSLKSGSGQGEREFQAEVDIISRVHHRHLVSLVGYCIAGGQRMLVYEFVPNGTMEYHLHGNSGVVLDWSKRLTVAVGSAKGLAYLHEDCHPRIIHRDIKAANILLDNNYEAMVADFGLAKLSADNFTHVSTRVMGTFGYMAPEYASSGKLTEKSDVFSFGVMLLELITGRRPVDTTNKYMDDSLVDWARPLLTSALADGDYDDLVDERLGKEYNSNEMKRMIACASSSIRHSAKRRPKMSQIVRALEGDVSLDDLNEGVRTTNQGSGSNMSSEYNTRAYNEDLQKFRKMAFESQEGDFTSTYGLNPSSSSDGSVSVSREIK